MIIKDIRKNILAVTCSTCSTVTNIFKYTKKKIFCSTCTATLATPLANKAKITSKKVN